MLFFFFLLQKQLYKTVDHGT